MKLIKPISIVVFLSLILIGSLIFKARNFDTGWCRIVPPKSENEFSKKQATLSKLSGVYRKLSLKNDEKLIITIKTGRTPEIQEKILFGKSTSEVSVFVYHYPVIENGREKFVNEIKIVDETGEHSSWYERPNFYSESSLLNHGLAEYREEILNDGKRIYFLQIDLSKEPVDAADRLSE